MNALVKVDNLNDVQTFAKDVKKFIYDNQMWMDIHGKGYVFVDGWSLMGGLLGLRPIVKEITNLSDETTIRYQATVELMQDDRVVGVGVAICTNKEKGKTAFDEYAVLSMAQTRAVGKAYRLNIGWIMKLAGFESTPFEEMQTEAVSPDKMAEIVKAAKNGKDS
jgi:hypothetical protein